MNDDLKPSRDPVGSACRLWAALQISLLVCLLAIGGVVCAGSKPSGMLIDGVLMKAFTIAFAEHIRTPGLTKRQQRIEGYRVQISEDEVMIVVLFIPKIPPGWRTFGADTPYGRSARYTIDKKAMRLIKRDLFK
jgi:hypothetical protein